MMPKFFCLQSLSICALFVHGAIHADLFDIMRKIDERMHRIHQEFDAFFSNMGHTTRLTNSAKSVSYTDQKEELLISIPLKKDVSVIEAKTKGNHTVVVEIPEIGTSIRIKTQKNRSDSCTVFVTTEYHQKEVQGEEDKQYQHVAFGTETSSYTIYGILDASKSLVEYNQENLIIRIPKHLHNDDEKKILVTMSKSENKNLEQEK